MAGTLDTRPPGGLNGTAEASGGDGLIRALDPRGRIAAAALFAVVVVALDDLPALAAAVGLAAVPMGLARLPPGPTLRKMLGMDGFIVFMLLMLPFTVPGTPLFSLGPLTASQEGLRQAVVIALKANAIILALLALVGTMEATVLGHALHRLKLPESLVYLMMFTVRYIEVMQQEYARLRTAMRARCFTLGTNRHTYRSIGYLLGMLLVRSLERSERILEAMKCRGFHGHFHLLDDFRFTRRDVWFAAACLAGTGGLILLEARHVLFA